VLDTDHFPLVATVCFALLPDAGGNLPR